MNPADLPVVRISRRAAAMVRRGYLWIFSNEVDMISVPPSPSWCRFVSGSDEAGIGYVNRHSLIAGRVVATDPVRDIRELVAEHCARACARRQSVVKHGCARLVFSESDLLPGLVVDWYGSVLVIQSNTAGMDLVADVVCELLPDTVRRVLSLQTGSVVLRADSGVRGLEGAASFTRVVRGGGEDLSNGWVDEDGIRVAADFIGGQKTGYFLDQHDNRARFEAHVAGERAADVLDLCCYSGGWGLRALRAGARAVFVDQSAAALQLVERAVSVNGFDPARALCVNEDVFDFLERDTRSYDVIVADPPAFVKSRKSLARARKAYEKLNRLAWRRLKPDGALFTCSCSYHLDEHDFHDTVALAVSKENGLAQEFYRGTQAEDHPALLSMPETRYLKCLGLRKLR